MDNIKNDRYYADKIISDLKFICRNMENQSLESFSQNELLSDSMNFRLIQIQENVKKLTDGFRTARPYIPWADIAGLRNHLVHDYGNVDMRVIYNTLKYDIPDLLREFEKNN